MIHSHLDLANNIAYTKFHKNLSICSEDIEWKQNSDVNPGPYLKISCNCPYLHFVNINGLKKG